MYTSIVTEQLAKLRQQQPLVVNITNYVVMNNTANALLALGASPLMAHSRSEMADMINISAALVINIGTFDQIWLERMRFAIEQANLAAKPVVLDPVGCGASTMRTQAARELARLADNLIVRGNGSEVMALAGVGSQTKGVDSLNSSEQAILAAQQVVQEFAAQQVIISGCDDYVVSHDSVIKLSNGSVMMPKVTGMGCTHTALTGAFAAIDASTAGLCATAVLGIAGQLAAQTSAGPGSLQMQLLDTLYQLNDQHIEQWLVATQVGEQVSNKVLGEKAHG